MRIELNRTGRWMLGACLAASAMALQVRASSCTISPATPASGQPVTVIYDPVGGVLAGAGTVYIHKGENGWKNVEDVAMTSSNGLWYLTYPVPEGTYQLDYVFTDLAGTWDNNNNQDWHFRTGSSAGVMMQGFYWDCPQGWYSTMSANASELRYMLGGYGIDRIWFPPPSKSDGGGYSMGYDPYDYYDLGQYYQQGTTSTRFGTQTQLKSTIAAYRDRGVACMADMVLNHRSGGASEPNPNTGGSSYTDFNGVASGQCTWNYNEFHPSTYETADPGVFESFPDICHVTANLPGSANYDLIEWGNWLTNSANAGFDGGWRFDYPKGIHASFVEDFRLGTGDAFGILEYWGALWEIENYVDISGGTSAFDFPAYYTMINVFNNGANIADLIDSSKVYAAKDSAKAVTFVANHDTDKDVGVEDIDDKMLAYAYILTYQGYPCIFWKDYFDYGLATLGGQAGNGIKPLVWVRGALGGGQPDIQLLKTNDPDLLVYGTQNGSSAAPGYIVVINNHDTSSQSTAVTTANTYLHGKTLSCHAWYSYASGQNSQPADVACNTSGGVTVQAPARGYAVYSVNISPPSPWTNADVGTDLDGGTMYLEDTYTLSGPGQGIQGTSDGFHYMYQTITGDCAIQAQVLSVENTHLSAKAGVMIRQGTTATARNAAVLVTPENGVSFQWRSSIGGSTSSTTVSGIVAPCWVRLIRSSNTYRGYYSTDGVSWTQIGTAQSISIFGLPRIGVVATSGDNNKVAACTLEHVDLNRTPVLSAVPDQSLMAGETLVLTNSATDADLPAQTLTYGLIDPPVGASIDMTSGVFSWRPLIAQSPSTQTVSVVVSDNGVPMLDSTEDFNVTVNRPVEPTIGSSTITNGYFGFSVNGDAGPDYTIQMTTNLVDGGWVPVSTINSPALPFLWVDTNLTTSAAQFYRIILAP